MSITERSSALIFKYRGFCWAVFAILVLAFPGRYGLFRFITGLTLLIIGQALRFWAAGVIPQYRTETIGAPELVTWGPYAYVRNPLYVGNFIMGFGWAVMLGWWLAMAFCAVFFVLYVLIVIPAEEKFLEIKFGDKYIEYKKTIPSMFPLLAGNTVDGGHRGRFDMRKAVLMEQYSVYVNAVITAVVIAKLFLFK